MSSRARAVGAALLAVGVLALTAWLLADGPGQGHGPETSETPSGASPGTALPEGVELPGRSEAETETALIVPEAEPVDQAAGSELAEG